MVQTSSLQRADINDTVSTFVSMHGLANYTEQHLHPQILVCVTLSVVMNCHLLPCGEKLLSKQNPVTAAHLDKCLSVSLSGVISSIVDINKREGE